MITKKMWFKLGFFCASHLLAYAEVLAMRIFSRPLNLDKFQETSLSFISNIQQCCDITRDWWLVIFFFFFLWPLLSLHERLIDGQQQESEMSKLTPL